LITALFQNLDPKQLCQLPQDLQILIFEFLEKVFDRYNSMLIDLSKEINIMQVLVRYVAEGFSSTVCLVF